jgi:toxin-antitoxin system PIN domain toxin
VSVTVDANVLVYASNEADPVHRQARALIEGLAAGPGLVYLFWPVLMGYLRLVTHPAILPRPLSPSSAAENVASLLALEHVRSPGESEAFWMTYQRVAAGDTVGNLVPDAHLVALMRDHDVATIYTRDRDFRRFDGVRLVDPFA